MKRNRKIYIICPFGGKELIFEPECNNSRNDFTYILCVITLQQHHSISNVVMMVIKRKQRKFYQRFLLDAIPLHYHEVYFLLFQYVNNIDILKGYLFSDMHRYPNNPTKRIYLKQYLGC